jgi:hypothetical protein
MQLKSVLWSLALLATISACEDLPDNENEKKFLLAEIFDSKTADAEFLHLNSIDTSKLSDIEKEATTVRREDVERIREMLKTDPYVIANMSRCLPGIVPPQPCPVGAELSSYIPEGSIINLTLLGINMDIPENPASRILQEGSMQLTTVDGKKVFANGSPKTYDKLFHTAWYAFNVKNPSLAKQPLILKIQTVIIVDKLVQHVAMEIPVPAETFLVQ